MSSEPDQLFLDALPEPAVSVSATYFHTRFFLDRKGTPRSGGYILSLVSTPFGGEGLDSLAQIGPEARG